MQDNSWEEVSNAVEDPYKWMKQRRSQKNTNVKVQMIYELLNDQIRKLEIVAGRIPD